MQNGWGGVLLLFTVEKTRDFPLIFFVNGRISESHFLATINLENLAFKQVDIVKTKAPLLLFSTLFLFELDVIIEWEEK